MSSANPLRVTRSQSLDDLAGAIPGAQVDIWQVAPERAAGTVIEARLPDVVLLSGTMSAPYIATVTIDQVGILLNTQASGRLTINGRTLDSCTVAVFGPGAEHTVANSEPCRWLAVQVSAPFVQAHFDRICTPSAWLARSETRHVTVNSDSSRALHGALDIVLHGNGNIAANAPVRSVQALVLSAIASCFEPSGKLLESAHSRIARRAMNYVRERSDDVVYLADLCLALGVSERWLRQAFQRTYGMNPTHVLRTRRLNQVRKALLARPGPASVRSVATTFGFLDHGRFARSYQELFDELPSTTLRGPRATSNHRTEAPWRKGREGVRCTHRSPLGDEGERHMGVKPAATAMSLLLDPRTAVAEVLAECPTCNAVTAQILELAWRARGVTCPQCLTEMPVSERLLDTLRNHAIEARMTIERLMRRHHTPANE